MTSKLAEAFEVQSQACAALDSPFMARLCHLIGERLARGPDLNNRLFDWQGDIGPRGHSVPLRLAGALHALRLLGRGGLAPVYPPHKPDDDRLWHAVSTAMTDEADFIERFIDLPPQTNEVRRAAALIAAGHWAAQRFGLPLVLSELGASGGLNLWFDRFALKARNADFGAAGSSVRLAPEWRGDLPPATPFSVESRAGVDLNPLDPTTSAGRLRLMAFLWADQPIRLDLTRAAASISSASPERGDGIDWLERRLAPGPFEGCCHLIYSTIAWQYFPPEARAKGASLIAAAGRSATAKAPVVWFTMEADDTGPGAALSVTVWPKGETYPLGRADFHGRWIDWKN